MLVRELYSKYHERFTTLAHTNKSPELAEPEIEMLIAKLRRDLERLPPGDVDVLKEQLCTQLEEETLWHPADQNSRAILSIAAKWVQLA